ncbi:hypothetical protein MTE01_03120 [Microbacterium testaceum]|uniref:Choice-of-anchor G family protein n=1 Tax=Microbacterium testaceum TaxID=2033 RepID=A0A4Y3QHB9_MICTE|nr:choice-of-anchor G family protein [Microbacterium testaceum]GEB44367.1 hypothetical protein MTE01_03120 [Microbacterium testaceum]
MHSTHPHTRTARVARFAAVGALATALVIPATAAHAADVVSQANGRLVDVSIAGTNVTDAVLALRGATAVNPDGSGDVTTDQPLDAEALAGLLQLSSGSNTLFGDNGILRLGAVGQYAQARDDGSSSAFSGAVSAAPSLIGVGTVTPSNVGSPSANDTATLTVGGANQLVGLTAHFGTLAASAQQAADGTQTGQYVLADTTFEVDGTLVNTAVGVISPAIDTLLAVAGGFGVSLSNPFAGGTVEVTLDDVLAAAGVADVNDLPPGTDLVSYIPTAVAKKITDQVASILDAVRTRAGQLGFVGAPLSAALSVAEGVINPVLNGLTNNVVAPLATALTALIQLPVNVQEHNADGSFTQTALRIGYLPGGSLARIDLASATVGPNAGRLAVPVAGAESLSIAGGMLGVAALLVAAVVIRRRTLRAVATARS